MSDNNNHDEGVKHHLIQILVQVLHLVAAALWFAVLGGIAYAFDRVGHNLAPTPADRTFVTQGLIYVADAIFVIDAVTLLGYLVKRAVKFIRES